MPPYAEARDDFSICADLAERLGVRERFTEGRSVREWLAHLYDQSRGRATAAGVELPPFEEFWEAGAFDLPAPDAEPVLLREFRADPDAAPLPTPSGRIEIFSERIEGFGYEDCPGHPVWREPDEWLGADARAKIPAASAVVAAAHRGCTGNTITASSASNPRSRAASRSCCNPADAAARDIEAGDVVRVFNDRGAFLAGVALSDGIRPGVAQIATGAWYDPDGSGLDKHGNPNVVTPDVGASRLSQGCAAQSALVEIERYDGPLPAITAFEPPLVAG